MESFSWTGTVVFDFDSKSRSATNTWISSLFFSSIVDIQRLESRDDGSGLDRPKSSRSSKRAFESFEPWPDPTHLPKTSGNSDSSSTLCNLRSKLLLTPHRISSRTSGSEEPSTYQELFELLEKAGYVSCELSTELEKMEKFSQHPRAWLRFGRPHDRQGHRREPIGRSRAVCRARSRTSALSQSS